MQLADKNGNLAFALRSAYLRHLLHFEQEVSRQSNSCLSAADVCSPQSESQLLTSRLVPKSTVRSSRVRIAKRKLDNESLGPAAAAGVLHELLRNDKLPQEYELQAEVAKALGVRSDSCAFSFTLALL